MASGRYKGAGWGLREWTIEPLTSLDVTSASHLKNRFGIASKTSPRGAASLGNLVHSLETRDSPDIASALRVLVINDIMETAGIELTAFRPPCEPAKKYH